jgi:hypothetical protein
MVILRGKASAMFEPNQFVHMNSNQHKAQVHRILKVVADHMTPMGVTLL